MIVRESIQSFERGGDPLKRMGIGVGRKLAYRKAKKEINDVFGALAKRFHKRKSIHMDIPPGDIHYIYAVSMNIGGFIFFMNQEEGIDGYEAGVEFQFDKEAKEIFPTIEEAATWLVDKINDKKAWGMLESMDFERGQEPVVSMGIGRKPLILKWIEEMRAMNIIDKPVIDRNLRIDANDVDISETLFNQFPEYIKFGTIYMDFKCFVRSPLALKSFPSYVGREMTVYYPGDVEKPFTAEDIRKVCEVGGYVIVEELNE